MARTVPDWTVVLGLAIVVTVLPGILVLESPRLACATAKEVIADPKHADNQLTVNKGSIIRVTVPRSEWPFGTFPDVASSNSGVMAAEQAPCGGQASDQAMTFEFKAVGEGSAQLETVGPTGNLFGFAWTAEVWDVTVGPDYGLALVVGIDAAAVALAGAFIWYRRRAPRPAL